MYSYDLQCTIRIEIYLYKNVYIPVYINKYNISIHLYIPAVHLCVFCDNSSTSVSSLNASPLHAYRGIFLPMTTESREQTPPQPPRPVAA